MSFSEYRKAAGFSTQEQLAKKLGLARSAVAKWETGRTYPKSELLPQIAQILHITEGEVIKTLMSMRNTS